MNNKINHLAIETRDLTRRFGNFTAVDRVNFSIRYGEIFGFLGANGSGKTTTIRMLCGILAPTSGTAFVAGFDVNKQTEQIKQSIGYVSQRFGLYTDLTVEENLKFYGQIYGITERPRIDEVLTMTGLLSWRNRLAGELSGGWKQKLGLANAIVHKPRILFLDEPTAGIDPVSRRSLWELLYQLADSGVALFVTTHYMEEAERCNQIAFISGGHILKIGQPNQLKENITGQLLEIECRPLLKASHIFQNLPGVESITAYGTTLHLNVQNQQAVQERIVQLAKKENINIVSMKPITASLEDVFATLSKETV